MRRPSDEIRTPFSDVRRAAWTKRADLTKIFCCYTNAISHLHYFGAKRLRRRDHLGRGGVAKGAGRKCRRTRGATCSPNNSRIRPGLSAALHRTARIAWTHRGRRDHSDDGSDSPLSVADAACSTAGPTSQDQRLIDGTSSPSPSPESLGAEARKKPVRGPREHNFCYQFPRTPKSGAARGRPMRETDN